MLRAQTPARHSWLLKQNRRWFYSAATWTWPLFKFCGHILKTSVHILDTSLHFYASLHVFSFCYGVQIYEVLLKNLRLPLYRLCSSFWSIIIAHHGNCFSVHLHVYCSGKVLWQETHIPSRERNTLFISCPTRSGVNKACMGNGHVCWQLLLQKLLLQSWIACCLCWILKNYKFQNISFSHKIIKSQQKCFWKKKWIILI